MTFYRVRYTIERGTSSGYSWHTTKRAARARLVADYLGDPAEYDHNPKSIDERIEAVQITPTKAGILDALTRWATYPDNG